MNMNEHRFQLQKYTIGRNNKLRCPSCGRKKCFVKYVDTMGRITLPDSVGICDRVKKCGYHYTPKDYFREHPEAKDALMEDQAFVDASSLRSATIQQEEPVEPSYIPTDLVEKTLGHYDINPLYQFLCCIFGKEKTAWLFAHYRVGTSKKWNGATVFWQVDVYGKVRTGKIMGYDAKTGHRIKEPFNHVNWVHAELKLPDFHLKQCLFGEHLLASYQSTPIMLVESEKTAIIGAGFVPQYLWLATGGINGCFKRECMEVLRGRSVTLMPDLGATEKWQEKLPMLSSICKGVSVSDALERIATDEQREAGLDIGDFLLMEPTKQQILQSMIERNPALQLLIDKLGLELVEEEST